MKAFIAVLCLAAAANAGVLTTSVIAPTVISRAPSLDSAVIQSDRIGGNFAYSVAESHAHVASTPIIQHVATPVAVSYNVPQLVAAPALTRTVVAAPTLARTIVAGPALTHTVVAGPALARTVVAGPVIAHSVGAPAATVRIA